MEKRLYDAAIIGDITTLSQLLQEDPLVLDKAILNCKDKNPLHVAAMLGNVEFVEAILQVHRSANYMCLSRDREGRNLVHLAAMYGKLGVLQVFIQAGHQAAMEKTDGGGTILHLCVKYNQLQALKMLLQTFEDPEFINAKNEDGMTILHLAIYYDQYQTIIYLLDGKRVGLNIRNANDKTALDLLRAKGDIDPLILSSLEGAEASEGPHIPSSSEVEFFEKARNAIMVVASLIATMAFQAGINPPGGVWQDDLKEGPSPHRVGEAVMAQTHPKYYRRLVGANTVAFVSSLSTIILLIRGVPRLRLLRLMESTMWVAIVTTAMTYGISLVTVAPKDIRGQLSKTSIIVLIVLMVWGGWMIILLWELFSKCLKLSAVKGSICLGKIIEYMLNVNVRNGIAL